MNRMAVDKPNTDTVYQTWLVVAYQLDASKSRAVGPVPGSKQQAKRRKEPGTILIVFAHLFASIICMQNCTEFYDIYFHRMSLNN